MLKYTIFEWFTPNDISLENRGVKPDYIIKNNQYIDHQLKKAQQLLN
jgi:C-terminal processing protease CtpA/Prc